MTCVRFLSNDVFISADDKGLLILWEKRGHQAWTHLASLCQFYLIKRCYVQWESTRKKQAHSKAISSLCALDDCAVTGSSDASVKIWKVQPSNEESGKLKLIYVEW